jgi:hypothetical protein
MARSCKGLVFRYHENIYWKDGIHKKQSWRLLKRDSCPGGCSPSCKRDLFDEDVSQCDIQDVPISWPDKPLDGEKYRLYFIPGSRDWETGYCDDWSWKMVEVL